MCDETNIPQWVLEKYQWVLEKYSKHCTTNGYLTHLNTILNQCFIIPSGGQR